MQYFLNFCRYLCGKINHKRKNNNKKNSVVKKLKDTLEQGSNILELTGGKRKTESDESDFLVQELDKAIRRKLLLDMELTRTDELIKGKLLLGTKE